MAKAKPCGGFPSKGVAVRTLVAQGASDAAIAEVIGEDPKRMSTIRSWALRHGVRKGGVYVNVPPDVLRALAEPAARRRLLPAELARRILVAVTSDQLVDAILDDGEGGA